MRITIHQSVSFSMFKWGLFGGRVRWEDPIFPQPFLSVSPQMKLRVVKGAWAFVAKQPSASPLISLYFSFPVYTVELIVYS